MNHRMKDTCIIMAFMLLICGVSFSQSRGYIENKGQWNESVQSKFQMPNGAAWFKNNAVCIAIADDEQVHEAQHVLHENPDAEVLVSGHAYEMRFSTSDSQEVDFKGRHSDYVNYFIGNNRSKWASRVGVYDEMNYTDIVPGISMNWSMDDGFMKYTYTVSPEVDPSTIEIEYRAVRKLELVNGDLLIHLPNKIVKEQRPYVFQIIKGQQTEVEGSFTLDGNKVGFDIGEYDASQPLYIDPVVVASTNVGSTVNTWGHSATFDQFGNIIGGGRPFGQGYPTDTGSFQMNFAGGGVDIGISKLNVDGSDLLWSTYIGGATSGEFVHSIVVNGFNQVVVYGKTSSSDYPVTENAFDTTHNGSVDICLTVLSDSGDSVIGSTYVGGEDADGQNVVFASYAGFKGEVVCDLYSNVYVASTSSSDSFPVTQGAFQTQRDSLQDAVVFKMTYNLTDMIFSTYLGSEANDAAFNLKPAKDNSVYVTGATGSGNFPVTNGAHDQTFNHGLYDAFITRLNQDGESILQSTFIESDSGGNDRGFFLQIDRNKDIYIMGSSDVITADTNKYAGPAIGSFIRKYTPELDSLYWTSTFANLSQSAFLVDNCKNIYAAGNGPGQVDTVNAVQASQAGFYVMLLAPEADTILMGSYYGSSGSHVDGGTSRFDKRGAVYQATCTAGNFPLTSTAWSGNQNGGTYDLTLFKIDMEVDAVVANAQVAPTSVGCAPFTVDFTNFGSEGLFHYWDFQDGDTSNLETPSHTFSDPGTYEVEYVIYDTAGCVLSDTATLIVVVHDSIAPEILVGPTECVDEVILTTNSAFSNYEWSTGESSQTIGADSAGVYWLQITNSCGTYSDTVEIDFTEAFHFTLPPDTGICDPDFLISGPDSAENYLWSTGDTVQAINIPTTGTYTLIADNGVCADTQSVNVSVAYTNIGSTDTVLCNDSAVFTVDNAGGPILWSTGDTTDSITIDTSGTFWVQLDNGYCTVIDTVNVTFAPLTVDIPEDTAICSPIVLSAFDSSFVSYNWSDGTTGDTVVLSSPGVVYLEVSNGNCTAIDSINVSLISYTPGSDNNQFYCDTLSAALAIFDRPNAHFEWSNGDTSRVNFISESGIYTVTITEGPCQWLDTFSVRFGTSPVFDLPKDYEMCDGDSIVVSVDSGYTSYAWSDGGSGHSVTIRDSGTFWVSVNNEGCEAREEFNVNFLDASRIVAQSVGNVLTPNGDGMNDAFFIEMSDYSVYTSWEIHVYNRWGMLVYHSSEPTIRWEGKTMNGESLVEGVYYYIISGETICRQKETVSYRGSVHVID